MDLNCDMGESFGAWRMGDDDAMLDLVTSANIACGFHAGDSTVMQRVCAAAVDKGVRIGAHVAYRDLAGFGRRAMAVTATELSADVLYQIGALDGFARAAGDRVRYVKAHGALYNTAAADAAQARALVAAIARYGDLAVLCPADSAMAVAAREVGVPVYAEVFADRAYTAEGALVSRSTDGAVLHDTVEVADRVLRMITTGRVSSHDGVEIELRSDSVCVHSDTPDAVALARSVRARCERAGVDFQAFT